jgi:hypothetical protein
MAEPISIAAALTGLVVTLDVLSRTSSVLKIFEGAQLELQGLSHEVKHLQSLLTDIRRSKEEEVERNEATFGRNDALSGIVFSATQTLYPFLEKLESYKKNSLDKGWIVAFGRGQAQDLQDEADRIHTLQ